MDVVVVVSWLASDEFGFVLKLTMAVVLSIK
jgi:hypothetical protein